MIHSSGRCVKNVFCRTTWSKNDVCWTSTTPHTLFKFPLLARSTLNHMQRQGEVMAMAPKDPCRDVARTSLWSPASGMPRSGMGAYPREGR